MLAQQTNCELLNILFLQFYLENMLLVENIFGDKGSNFSDKKMCLLLKFVIEIFR